MIYRKIPLLIVPLNKCAIATQVIANIEDNPNWKQKAIKAYQQGLLEAIKTNPVGVFVVSAIASWRE